MNNKKLRILGIAIMAIFVFVFTACEIEPPEDRIQGTWMYIDPQNSAITSTWIFSGNNWSYAETNNVGNVTFASSGTFSINGDKITFNQTSPDTNSFTETFSIYGDKITFTHQNGSKWAFIKQ